jgi:glucokinase
MTQDTIAYSGRLINRRTVVRLLLQEGPMTRVDIARFMGLSKPTVGVLVSELEADGLVAPTGLIEGKVGRAATEYSVRPDIAEVAAVDLSRTIVSANVTGLKAGQASLNATERNDMSSADALLSQVGRMVRTLSDRALLQKATVKVLSVAMPGVTDPRTGRVAFAPKLPDFGEINVRAELEAKTGCSVVITNDVNAAALGERARGHGANIDDFAFVHIGPGLGAGLVLDGELRVGPSGTAGEISWLPFAVLPDDGEIIDLRRGGLEAALDASQLLVGVAASDLETYFQLVASGDQAAQASARRFSWLVAQAIASMSATLDLSMAVLGGELGNRDEFLPLVREQLTTFASSPPTVMTSALGPDAALMGAAAIGADLAREMVLELATSL